MKVHTYKCDVCGVEKKEANRWWMVAIASISSIEPGTFVVVRHGEDFKARLRGGVFVGEWEQGVADVAGVYHSCGEQHVQELVSRYTRTGSLEPGRKPTSMPAGGAS